MAPVCPSSILFRLSSNPLHPLGSPYFLLGAKDCGVLFGWLLGLCWQRLQGSGYHRQKVWPWHGCPDNCTLCVSCKATGLSLRFNSDARWSDVWCCGEYFFKGAFEKPQESINKAKSDSWSRTFSLINKESTYPSIFSVTKVCPGVGLVETESLFFSDVMLLQLRLQSLINPSTLWQQDAAKPKQWKGRVTQIIIDRKFAGNNSLQRTMLGKKCRVFLKIPLQTVFICMFTRKG